VSQLRLGARAACVSQQRLQLSSYGTTLDQLQSSASAAAYLSTSSQLAEDFCRLALCAFGKVSAALPRRPPLPLLSPDLPRRCLQRTTNACFARPQSVSGGPLSHPAQYTYTHPGAQSTRTPAITGHSLQGTPLTLAAALSVQQFFTHNQRESSRTRRLRLQGWSALPEHIRRVLDSQCEAIAQLHLAWSARLQQAPVPLAGSTGKLDVQMGIKELALG